MSRPRTVWSDPFAALEHLRAFLAVRCRAAGQPIGSWLGRALKRLRRLQLRAARAEETRPEKAALELQPMDFRNPPSENIAQTALPLAVTAAAAAAAVYFAASWHSEDPAVAGAAERVGAGPDAVPVAMGPVTLDNEFARAGAGGRIEEQLPPPHEPGRGSAPEESAAARAIDGAGTTLQADDEFERHGGGGGGAGDVSYTSEGGGSAGGGGSSGPLDSDSGFGGGFGSAGVGGLLGTDPGPGIPGLGMPGFGAGSDGSGLFPAPGGTVPTGSPAGPGALAGPTGNPTNSPSTGPRFTGGGVLVADSARQPVRFIANVGQFAEGIDFAARGNGYGVSVTRDALAISVARPATGTDTPGTGFDTVRLEWAGVRADATAVGERPLGSVSNYLLGNDPADWHTNVSEFAAVRYADAWDGIDLVYHQADDQLIEYDLVVRPGSSADGVGFAIRGADPRVDEQGRLVLTTPSGAELVQHAPVVYQTAPDGSRESVAGAYRLREDGTVGFEVGAYDPSRDLVIDPVVQYSSTLGGSAADVATAVATDASGNVFVVGYTSSSDFPVTTGVYDPGSDRPPDVFVAKLGPTGSVVWATYLSGPQEDRAYGVAVDALGQPVVTGTTASNKPGNTYPVTTGAYLTTAPGGSAAFLTKLSADGTTLVYSTFFGGTLDDEGRGVAIDPTSGEAVITGWTSSTDLPTQNPAQGSLSGTSDAFVTRFNAAGSALVYSSYLGGSGTEQAYGVAVDGAGDALVVGRTTSSNFPTVQAYDTTLGGTADAFVARYSAAGVLKQSTYFGGSGDDGARAVAVDATGRVYVAGTTTSSDLPVQNAADGTLGGSQDGFVARFASLSYAPEYATYWGGSGTDALYGVGVDADNRAVVTGIDGTSTPVIWTGRYASDGSSVVWSATGASGASAAGNGVAVGLDGTAHVAGTDGSDVVSLGYGAPPAPVVASVSDGTGESGSDGLTNDNTVALTGTAYPDSVVSVYAQVPTAAVSTLLGTVTADGSGNWSYTTAALADGAPRITTKATAGGMTSVSSAVSQVTIDTTPPVVAVQVLDGTQTYDTKPAIVVTASDLNRVSGTVVLSADLNNDGDFLDANEAAFATGPILNGAVVFVNYPVALPVGTITLKASAIDVPGNTGTSTFTTIRVAAGPTNWPTAPVTSSTRGGYNPSQGPPLALMSNGIVTLSVLIDPDETPPCQSCPEQLWYDSSAPGLKTPIQAVVQSDGTRAVPGQVIGTLTLDGVAVGTDTWSGADLANLSPGGAWVFGIPPASALATGRHTYTLDLFLDYGGVGDVSRSVSGQTFVVNRSDSLYGVGWSFANTDALVTIAADGTYPAGVLRIGGRGEWRFYADAGGGTYTSPTGDAGTLVASGGGWVYTGWDGIARTFDSSGRQTTLASADGENVVTYTYSGAGAGTAAKLATMTSPDGGVATFTYDVGTGLLATIAAPGGRTTTFTMSGTDLVTVADPSARTQTFTYSAHQVIGTTAMGVSRQYTYTNGRAQTVKVGSDPVGTVVAAVAAGVGVAAKAQSGGTGGSFTTAAGATDLTWFDGLGQPVQSTAPDGAVESYVRDANGYVTKYTDALGYTTTFTVNAAGQITGLTRSDGSLVTMAYGGAYGSLSSFIDYRGGVWTYTNDAYGRQTSATDPLGHTTTYTYTAGRLATVTDPLGQVVTYIYDTARRLTGTLVGGAVTGTTGYDAAGNPVTFTDALGNVTTRAYDAAGRLTGVTDPLNQRTTWTYASSGLLLSMTDALGNVTSYAYDASGRLAATIGAYGTGLAQRTTGVYDSVGNLVATVDPLGHRTTSVYDSLNRVIAMVDPLGNRATVQYDRAGHVLSVLDPLGRVTQFGYDSLGRLVSTTDALGNVWTSVYDANSNLTAQVDPLGHRSTSVYDAADRLIASVDALGNRTSYGYDNADRPVSFTDPLGNVSTTVYDARGRVSSTIDALNKRVTFGYDAADNPVTVTDPNGNVTTAVYDVLNRPHATIDALGNRSTVVFDAVGNVLAAVDALGHRTTSVYDALNRPIAMIDALGNRATAVYDAADRVVAMVDALGNRTTAVYDDANRLIATVDALGFRSTSAYDAVGNVVASVDALGNRTSYAFDGLNRVVATSDPLGAVSSVSYDTAGRMVTGTDARGNVTTAVYDNADRLIATVDALGSRSTSLYDAAGNVTVTIDALNHRTTFTIDALSRVQAVTDALNQRTTFVYDDAGNMVATIDALGRRATSVYDKLNRVEATVDALANRSTSVFDAAGNTTAFVDARNSRTTFVYDELNRVQATVDALANRSTTTFDAAGNVRTIVDALNRTTTFGYDARNMPVTATDALGNVWTTQYDELGRAWRQIDPLGNDTRIYFDAAGRATEFADQLGNRRTTSFDAAGNPVASVDPLGNRTTISFDALNRAESVLDPLGNRTTSVYDKVGNQTATIDALGRRTTAMFDALDRTEAIVDALGNRSTVVYDAVGNVAVSVDALGRRTTATYDALDRVVEVQDALGNRSTAVYDTVGNHIANIDALDRRTTTVYDELNRAVANIDALGNRATSVYDAAGQVTVSIDTLGNRTTATFDAVGNVVAMKDAQSNVTTSVYDAANRPTATIDALGRRVTATYDARGMVTAVTDALGTISQAVYDAAGNTLATIDGLGRRTTRVYDALNRAVATIDALGNRSTATFDAIGNVASTKDVLGRATTYGYDALDRLVTVTDALGYIGTTAYDAVGNLTASTNPLNQTTTFGYDALDRRVSATDPLNHTSTVVYDAAGQLVASVNALGHATSFGYDARGRLVTTTDALGNVTTSGYDAAGNRTTVTDARGFTTTAVFDTLNRQIAVVDPLGYRSTVVFDAAGQISVVIDQLGFRTTSSYDVRGRFVSVTDALNHTSTTVYDLADNVVARTDALGNTTTTVYDALNRPVAEVDPLGFRTTSTFDAAGNRTVLQDAVGNRTTWVYDALNRVVTETDPLNHSATFAYDAAGRQTSQTDRLGRRRDFAFDAAGRVSTEKWYAVGGSLTQTQTWTYDAANRMLTAQDPDGTYTFAYDAANRATSVQEPFGLALTFGYDAVDNRTSVQDSKGGTTTLTFDALNRQTSEQTAGSGISAMRFDHAYTARGQVASVTRYSNLAGTSVVGTTTHDYDAAGRQTHLKDTNGSGSTLAEYTYTYDATDRLSAKVENGVTTSYGYDAADQLTADGATTFGYDGTGNRTNAGYVTGGGNQMTGDGVWTWTYDANGNVTKRSKGASSDTWVYTYDNRNQVVSAAYSATDGGTVTQRVTYVYDAFGNRIERDYWNGSTTTVTRYGVDGWDPAKPSAVGNESFDTWVDLDGSNALVTRYVWGPEFDQAVARQDSGGAVGWYLSDRQMSVRLVIDNAASVLATTVYSGFGQVTGGSLYDRHGFTGHDWDAALGLWVTPARLYDPFTGRFLQQDAMGFAAGDPNLFRYVGNSPTNATDPSGLEERSKEEYDQAFVVLQSANAALDAIRLSRGYLPEGFDLEDWTALGLSEESFRSLFGDLDYVPHWVVWEAFDNDPDENYLYEFADEVRAAWGIEPPVPAGGAQAKFELPDRIYWQNWHYTYALSNIVRYQKERIAFGKPETLYGTDPEYTALVDQLAALAEKMKIQPPKRPGDNPSYGAWYRKCDLTPEEELAILNVQNVLDPAELKRLNEEANDLVKKILRRAHEVRFPRINRFAEGFVWGFVKAGDGIGQVMANPDKVRQGLQKLATDEKMQQKLLEELEKKLQDGSAENVGELTFDVTTLVTGGPAAVKLAGKTGKIMLTLTRETAQKLKTLVKGGGKIGAKELDELLINIRVLNQSACFVAGTPLLTPEGSKPIEEFCRGDVLFSRDERDIEGIVTPKMVEEVFVRFAKLIQIHIGERVIGTTAEHPFWVQGKGWLPARELVAGDRLVGHDGQSSIVAKIVDPDRWETVYNLRVADFHTYFVGGDEWGFSYHLAVNRSHRMVAPWEPPR